jgi:hypothetical protein
MIRICKRPAAADGDETGIAIFGKDHSLYRPYCILPMWV